MMKNRKIEDKDRGAVLLTTLLVMSIMAALAVTVMEDLRVAVSRAITIQDYAQADWYMIAAGDFTETQIQAVAPQINNVAINARLAAADPILFPLERGVMTLELTDASRCFSLNALITSEGLARAEGQRQFEFLLNALGVQAVDAQTLVSSVTDWADMDNQVQPGGAEDYTYLGLPQPYRTANTPFTSVTELRAINGMSEELFEVLRSYVCIRKPGTDALININALGEQDLPILASILGDQGGQAAIQLLTERPPGGWPNRDAFLETPALATISTKDAAFNRIIFTPDVLRAEVSIVLGTAQKDIVFEYTVPESGKPERVYRAVGAENFRPDLNEDET